MIRFTAAMMTPLSNPNYGIQQTDFLSLSAASHLFCAYILNIVQKIEKA